MEATDGGGAPLLATYVRGGRSRLALDGRLKVSHWSFAVDAPGFYEAASALVAAAYVDAKAAWTYPAASLGPRLPKAGTTSRKGDFGEIVAGILYSQRLGRPVPFQRIESKPVQGATVQGADLLALTVDYGEQPKPTIVEVKYRAKTSPAGDLKTLASSLAVVDEDYLVSAWGAGVHLMDKHPDHRKSFALSAAQQLGRLTHPDEPLPPHDRQAVVVTGGGSYTDEKLKEHWGTTPPVSELHIFVIADIEAVMDRIYNGAADLDYSATQSGVPALMDAREHLPGVAAPLSSTEAKRAIVNGQGVGTLGLVEASLWLLADWDGMGVARARHVLDAAADPVIRGLAQVLTGAIAGAQATLAGNDDLLAFAEKVRDVWALEASGTSLLISTYKTARALADPGLQQAVIYVGGAVRHRLIRHPGTMTDAAGAIGPNVKHVVERWQRIGHHALWPSQATALGAGLLDRGHPSLAIKMPTSAGKTALMELLVADALDTSEHAVVAVLAPTKALVSQLSSDLRRSLAQDVHVRSSHGGLDFDTETPGAAGILVEPGATVMTPERFDLEWRRAATGDEHASTAALELIVVDEAHLLASAGRGARLELVLARALRRGIRVVVLSSQFPRTEQIADWLGGKAIESEWTPTWLERFVYFPEGGVGLLQAEAGDPVEVLALSKDDPLSPGRSVGERTPDAAALAEQYVADGLVVIYSNQRNYIPKLVDAAVARFPPTVEVHSELETLAGTLELAEPDYAAQLRAGIGVHHALVPRGVRQAVEHAARRGWLRVIICTSTLLEGVDFPTRTVIAAYTPQMMGKVEVARLRNLAGRAGRAGRFISGTMVVMVAKADDAPKWLRAFRAQLPLTESALARALNKVRLFARHLDVLEQTDQVDLDLSVANLDALIVAAAIEGAVVDGDFRAALEDLLGRTLWYTEANDYRRTTLLNYAVQRAQRVSGWAGGDQWTTAFYRAGLPFASSMHLRDRLLPHAGNLAAVIDSADGDHDAWLLWLATSAAPATGELSAWDELDKKALSDALRRWIAGVPEAQIREAYPDLWEVVARDLETLLPWVLTGAIEFVATATGRPDLRELGHLRLGIARMRYGVPAVDLCDLVREGLDRVDVAVFYAEFSSLLGSGAVSIFDRDPFIRKRVQEAEDQARAAAEAARPAPGVAGAVSAGVASEADPF